ncbi:hypothetical protein [Sneathiella aquimaris]|uniref:hypothetical protein n=1 Tax=Sneathiella aquimaris TaxID=2599305 RepID=UPI00146CD9F4|nr:hypothetical protein [Sneathiella aquimaris]
MYSNQGFLLAKNGFLKLISAGVLVTLLASCSGEKKEKVIVVKTDPAMAVVPDKSLQTALSGLTGFSLGRDLSNVKKTGLRICAAKMRYGDAADSKIAQLYCFKGASDQQASQKFWVNFTSPIKGHKAWKITMSLSEQEQASQNELVDRFTKLYGAPRVVEQPLSYSWKEGDVFLTLVKDAYGVQLELWDRSLHTIS